MHFSLCRTGTTGTPEWIPPEAWDIENQYDSSYDIWGVGLVLYYLLYRKLPWKYSRLDQSLLKGIERIISLLWLGSFFFFSYLVL
jgi:serine/threonine protein kinase